MAILNFGLRFERLQATFYTQADELGTIATMADAKRQWARTLGAHERAHVRIIKQVLGSKAGPRPSFDFGEANATDAAFTRTAVAMEDLTVALLTGIVPAVQDRGLTAALLGLLTVEARHAAWARNIVGAAPVPAAFDQPKSLARRAGRARADALHRAAAEDERQTPPEVHGLMAPRVATALGLTALGSLAALTRGRGDRRVAGGDVGGDRSPAAAARSGLHARPAARARLDAPPRALGAGPARDRSRGRGRRRPHRSWRA